MDHLLVKIENLDEARHPARGAERQGLFDPALIGAEKHQRQVAGLVLCQHPKRAFAAGRAMFGHAHFEGRDRADGRLGDFRTVAAVDAGNGQVKQNVEHACRPLRIAEQPVEQFSGFWADAGQGAGLGEEGIEKRGPHG